MNSEINNRRILSLALDALKLERQKIDAEILGIQERLGEKPRRPISSRSAPVTASRSRISPAGLKAIAAAQKKRWAAHKAAKGRRS